MAYRIEGALRSNRVPKRMGKRLRERNESNSFVDDNSIREQRRDGRYKCKVGG